LLGAPFLYAAAAWRSHPLSPEAAQASVIPPICGALGVVLAAMAILPRLLRRDLGGSKLEFAGMALTLFNLIAISFIVVGRTANMHVYPSEVVAPRYLFWSSLFWAGLFLVWIEHSDSWRRARWLVFPMAWA